MVLHLEGPAMQIKLLFPQYENAHTAHDLTHTSKGPRYENTHTSTGLQYENAHTSMESQYENTHNT